MTNDNEDNNVDSVAATAPLDINGLVRAMLEQNRLREQQMDAIVNKLLDQKRNDPPVVPAVIPNQEHIIPMFTGESGDTDAATEWVNALKTVAHLNGWPDTYTLEAGRSHLGGAARHWYLSHMTELDTMNTFITSFEMMFTSQDSITETWKKLDERVQQRGETVYAYFHDKVRMYRRLKLTPIETKKMVCIGLKSREMCAAILSNSHTSEVELLADIRMYTEVHSNRSERYRTVSTYDKKNVTKTFDKGVEQGSKPIIQEQPSYTSFKKGQNASKSTIAGPKCYNCQLIGHIARDCTRAKSPLQFSKCVTEGHTAKYCQAVTTDVTLIDTNTVNRTVYVKRVQINDDPEENQGLVDTGSALCIIKRSIAKKYGLTIKPRTVNLNVYGNTPCVIGGGDTMAYLKIDSMKEPVDLLVVDDHIQNYDVIIGRTFINKENVSFIKTSNQLIFDYNMPLPYSEEPNETITGQPANVEVILIEREKEPITASMVKHNQSFTKDEVTRLVNLMNEYRLCFAFNIFELGRTNALTMDIVDNNVPVVSRPYRASAAERDIIDKIVSKWTADQVKAFERLKHNITSSPALQLFNPSSYTELHCEASQVGLSGMLLQRGESDKKMHLVHAVSKKTTTAEKNYHAGKLELTAIVWSITRLRHLLIGIPFTVITDCQAIVHLHTKRTVNPQVARWANLLSEYEFEVRHRPGTKMAHADALSQAPVDIPNDTEQELEEYEVMLAMTEEEHVMAMQRSDEKLRYIIDNLTKRPEERSVAEDSMVKDHVLRAGILYRTVKVQEKTRQLWVVPDRMRKSLVVRCHDLSGHFALDRTVSKIKERYYFARMRRYVRYHIKCCPECMLSKVPKGRQQGELHPIPPGKRPFEIIHLDHIGPFIKSTSGNNHILVLVDNLTKYVKLYAVRRYDTDSVLKCLKSFVLLHGLPKKIISDRGTAFTSKRFETYCESGGIKHTLISVRHPQSNGQVERVNSTLVPVLQANMTNERDWDKKLLEVESQLNNSQNKIVGDTPFRILYGYHASFHDGVLRHLTVEEEYEDVNKLQEQARVNIEKEQVKWKNRYDQKHTKPVQYKVGEVVFLRRPAIPTGEPTKLQPKFRGPLIINKVLPNDVYQVADVTVKEGRQYVTTAHASHFKVYKIGADCDNVPNNMTDELIEVTDSDEVQSDEKEKTENKTEAVPDQPAPRVKRKPSWLRDYTL